MPSSSRIFRHALVLLTLLTPLTACTPSYAVRSYNDPFEGPTRGYVLHLDATALTGIAAREAQGGHKLEVMFVNRGEHATVVPTGTPVDLRLGNQVVRWTTTAEAQPVSNVWGYSVITQWKLPLELTPDQMTQLSRAPLHAVRANIGGEPYTLELSPSQQSVVQENMGILLTPADNR